LCCDADIFQPAPLPEVSKIKKRKKKKRASDSLCGGFHGMLLASIEKYGRQLIMQYFYVAGISLGGGRGSWSTVFLVKKVKK